MKTLVMKFGGTSTGSVRALHRAADIVISQTDHWDRVVVVVSAMDGVTNMLIECAERAHHPENGAYQAIVDELREKIGGVVSRLFAGDSNKEQLIFLIEARIGKLINICQQIQQRGKISAQEAAEIAAVGERINVHVFSAFLRKFGLPTQAVDASELIVTDDCYQAATLIQSATDGCVESNLSPLLDKGVLPVVTGYIGATLSGATTTLGRGGSDYTAAILAKSLNADEVWIWTDVDGVLTADPNLIPGARLIPDISYNIVHELANFGAKVLHPKTILPAREADIPVWIKNTFQVNGRGTRISHNPQAEKFRVTAVTGGIKTSLIIVRIRSREDYEYIKTHLLDALAKRGIYALTIFQEIQKRSICFAFPEKIADQAIQVFEGAMSISSPGGGSVLQVRNNTTIITAVGREIYKSPQARLNICFALVKAGVDVILTGEGTSPDSLVLLVEEKDGERAINQIHDEVILNEPLTTPYPNLYGITCRQFSVQNNQWRNLCPL